MSNWVSTAIAASKLGISSKHLLRLREDNTFKERVHWRDISRNNSARPTYRWHLDRCQKVLQIK